jgi:hypothetical protein
MKILTQRELDMMKCQVSGCTCGGELFLHSQCHVDAPVWCAYHPEGFLSITCSVCNEEIAKIEVATGKGGA